MVDIVSTHLSLYKTHNFRHVSTENFLKSIKVSEMTGYEMNHRGSFPSTDRE